jgi:hypothetical protein
LAPAPRLSAAGFRRKHLQFQLTATDSQTLAGFVLTVFALQVLVGLDWRTLAA